jgi:hypothetical protein
MTFLKNTACPNCRKQGKDRAGDNLATYSDGGFYCWSCGFSKKGISLRPQVPIEASERSLEAFSRWSPTLPAQEIENLLERGFKLSELRGFLYDYSWDRRIYPVYSGKELVFYEARSRTAVPKSIQKGQKPIHVLGVGNPVVLVEDLLSAIKVSRHCRAMPLWGSSLVRDWIPYLIGLQSPVVLWLDSDKLREASKIAGALGLVGIATAVIRTDKDPKDLTDKEINEALNTSGLYPKRT